MKDTDKEQNMEENGETDLWERGTWGPPDEADEEPPTGPEEESGTRFSFSDKRKIKKETHKKSRTLGGHRMSRTACGLLCLALALILCFAVAPWMNASKGENVTIVRLSRSVEKGEILTAKDLETVSVGAYHLPKGVLKSTSEIIGRRAAQSYPAGLYLLPAMLSGEEEHDVRKVKDIFSELDDEHLALSIPLGSLAAGLSGNLRCGDIVSVFVCSGKDQPAVLPEELRYILVIGAVASDGSACEEEGGKVPSSVQLMVCPRQAALLVSYAKAASVHLALVFRGPASEADRYLAAQQEILDSIE